jgi:xylan 1,4-beta-xylosidase
MASESDARAVVDFDEEAREFTHFFSAGGYNNTDFTYTPQYRRQYSYLSSYPAAPTYIRMHNILTCHGRGDYYFREGDDYNGRGEGSVCRVTDSGDLAYDWTYVDKVYDVLVDHDMKPIVEIERMPPDLQKPDVDYPAPRDYDLWRTYVEDFVHHLTDRYGHAEVATWYFETWNEPDNHRAWGSEPGDYTDFFRYWDHAVDAIKSVSEEYRVGGPGTKQMDRSFDLFEQFLEHCVDGRNHCTGESGTPIDFVSVHCKGVRPSREDEWPRSEKVLGDVGRYLDILDDYPSLSDVEFFNDESDVAWSGNKNADDFDWLEFRNTRYFAGFNCKLVDRYCRVVEDEYDYDMSRMVADNCHLHWEGSFFSANRSRLTPVLHYPTTDLVKKPVFNSHQLLEKLGTRRYVPSSRPDGDGVGVLPTAADGYVAVLVWNFDDDPGADAKRTVRVDLENVPLDAERAKLVEYRIDEDHSNAYAAWNEQGSPRPPGRDQIREIRREQNLATIGPVRDVDATDPVTLEAELSMHSVSLFLLCEPTSLSPEADSSLRAYPELDVFGDPSVFLTWDPIDDHYVSHYLVTRLGPEETVTFGEEGWITAGTFVDMDAAADAEYEYRVSAVDFEGRETDTIATRQVATTEGAIEF